MLGNVAMNESTVMSDSSCSRIMRPGFLGAGWERRGEGVG